MLTFFTCTSWHLETGTCTCKNRRVAVASAPVISCHPHMPGSPFVRQHWATVWCRDTVSLQAHYNHAAHLPTEITRCLITTATKQDTKPMQVASYIPNRDLYPIRSFTCACPISSVPLLLNRMNAFKTWSFPCYFCILCKIWNNRKVQAKQQPRVSIVSTGKGRNGLLMFDNSDLSMTIGLMLTVCVHAQCACKQMNVVFGFHKAEGWVKSLHKNHTEWDRT